MRRLSPPLFLLLLTMAALCNAAEVPKLLNYQGALSDANENPSNGAFDMVFRFYDSDGGGSCAGGALLLTDSHLASNSAGAVTISDGLFNVALGGGALTAGTVSTLSGVFRDHEMVYVEVQIEAESLCPRTRVLSSAYSINAARESDGSLDLYVSTNHLSASDDNDGLSPSSPKKTIQSAIDAVPVVLGGMATINVADGTYTESLLIDRRLMRNSLALIIIEGNQGSPASVILDGEGTRDVGLFVTGFAGISGMEITGFTEEGISVAFGSLAIEHCRITAAAEENSLGVFRSDVELSNTLITNSVGPGIEMLNNSNMVIGGGTTISGPTAMILLSSSGLSLDFDIPGNIVIQGNAGPALDIEENTSVNFEGWSPLTILATAGDAMKVNYHSTIRGYGNGTVGICSATNNSFCHPFSSP